VRFLPVELAFGLCQPHANAKPPAGTEEMDVSGPCRYGKKVCEVVPPRAGLTIRNSTSQGGLRRQL